MNVLLFRRTRGNWRRGTRLYEAALRCFPADVTATPLPLAAKLKSHRIACSGVSFFNNTLSAQFRVRTVLSECQESPFCGVGGVNLRANLRHGRPDLLNKKDFRTFSSTLLSAAYEFSSGVPASFYDVCAV